MELQKDSIIAYELSFSTIIEESQQIYLKIDRVSEIKDDIIITESGDKISIEQIIRNIGTKELNSKYIPNWILTKKIIGM